MASSSTAIAANIFTSPSEAFEAIREQARVWFPLLVLFAGYSAVSILYTSNVDMPWFMEQQLAAGNPDLTDAQREQAATMAASMPPVVYGVIGAVSTCVIIALYLFVLALYYTGVSFVSHDGVRLKQWFALVCWCALPTVLGLVAQIVNLSAADVRFAMQDEINPISFGNLFSIEREGVSILQRILLSLDPTALWSMALMVLGYQAWTQSSVVKAVTVVLGPAVAIVAIATLFTLI